MFCLCTELIFPLITTAAGAVIGGFFAYRIAKSRFASDYLNEGITGILIIKSSIDNILVKSKKVQEQLNEVQSEDTVSDFLKELFKKTKNC